MFINLEPHIEPHWRTLMQEGEYFDDVVAMVGFFDTFARDGMEGILRTVEQYEKCLIWHEDEDRTLFCLQATERLWSFFSTYRSAMNAELIAEVHEVFEPDEIELVEIALRARLDKKESS